MSGEAAKATTRAGQFHLRDLFIATTCVAVAAGLAHYAGLGTLPFSCGALLVLANRYGWFERLQRGAPQRVLGLLATALFAGSLFLPSMKGCNGTHLKGWEIAQLVALHEADVVYKTAAEPEKRQEAFDNPVDAVRMLVLLTGLNLGNLLLATAVLAPWRWRKWLARIYPSLATFGAASCWLVTWRDDPTAFLVGWWVWLAASYMLALLVRPPWVALAPAAVLWLLVWYK